MEFKKWLMLSEGAKIPCTTERCRKFNELVDEVNDYISSKGGSYRIAKFSLEVSSGTPMNHSGLMSAYVTAAQPGDARSEKAIAITVGNVIRHVYSNYDEVWKSLQDAYNLELIDTCLYLDIFDELSEAATSMMYDIADKLVRDDRKMGIDREMVLKIASEFAEFKKRERKVKTIMKYGTKVPCPPGRGISDMREKAMKIRGGEAVL